MKATTGYPFDPAAAATVHFVDPRVRRLAEAAWRLRTGGSSTDWLILGKDDPEALIREARDWIRAAVAAGLLSARVNEDAMLAALTPEQRRGNDCYVCAGPISTSEPDEHGIVLAGRQMFVHVDRAVCDRVLGESAPSPLSETPLAVAYGARPFDETYIPEDGPEVHETPLLDGVYTRDETGRGEL